MKEKIAVVTGGTRGIGSSISRALKDRGVKVAAIYYGDEEAAERQRCEFGIPAYKFNVGDYEACQEGMKQMEQDLGPVDILVNNAGITRDGMFHKMSSQHWHDVITTNLTSCFNMTRCVIEGMRERGFGRIINISSINAEKGQLGQVNYAAAKAGMIGFTKSLALENARKGITVNVIAPGYIETDMLKAIAPDVLDKIIAQIPVGRLGQGDEIARMVVFLAEENSGFITGATFDLNGGQYMS